MKPSGAARLCTSSFLTITGPSTEQCAGLPIYPGDPLTPGVGATKDAKRLDLKDVNTITTIPVLPISYGDAQPLLAALRGPVAPDDWRGAAISLSRI